MRITAHYQDEEKENMYSGQRSYYLALALDARRALNALEAGKDLKPAMEAIKSALESLKALRTPQELYKRLHSAGGYEHLEQLRTLEDVQGYFKDEDLLARLEALNGKPSLDAAGIIFVQKFFLALESRALHYYDDPSLAQQSA